MKTSKGSTVETSKRVTISYRALDPNQEVLPDDFWRWLSGYVHGTKRAYFNGQKMDIRVSTFLYRDE